VVHMIHSRGARASAHRTKSHRERQRERGGSRESKHHGKHTGAHHQPTRSRRNRPATTTACFTSCAQTLFPPLSSGEQCGKGLLRTTRRQHARDSMRRRRLPPSAQPLHRAAACRAVQHAATPLNLPGTLRRCSNIRVRAHRPAAASNTVDTAARSAATCRSLGVMGGLGASGATGSPHVSSPNGATRLCLQMGRSSGRKCGGTSAVLTLCELEPAYCLCARVAVVDCCSAPVGNSRLPCPGSVETAVSSSASSVGSPTLLGTFRHDSGVPNLAPIEGPRPDRSEDTDRDRDREGGGLSSQKLIPDLAPTN